MNIQASFQAFQIKKTLFFISLALLLACGQSRHGARQNQTPEDWWLWTASWQPGTQQIAAGGTQDSLRLFSATERRLIRNYPFKGTITRTAWHPSKDLIVAVGEYISIVDLETGKLSQFPHRKEEVLMLCVDWHPSGELFVTGDYGDAERAYPALLQFWTYDGKNIKSIEKSKAEYRTIKWSEDGSLLASASESIRLWNKNGDLVAEKASKQLLWGIDWNKEGTKLVSTDMKGGIAIWDKQLKKLGEIR